VICAAAASPLAHRWPPVATPRRQRTRTRPLLPAGTVAMMVEADLALLTTDADAEVYSVPRAELL